MGQDFSRRALHTPPERRLPVIAWSRLFFDLEPYLAEPSAPGGTVVNFYLQKVIVLIPAIASALLLAGQGAKATIIGKQTTGTA
jgi:hypothetical protein